MKSKGALFICIVAIIAIVVIIIPKGNRPNNDVNNGNIVNNQSSQSVDNSIEEYVSVKEDGTKVNTSEQLKATKVVEGLQLSNIKLTTQNGITELTASATNTTDVTIETMDIIVSALDKDGNTLVRFLASVDNLEAGQVTNLKASVTADVANAYDFMVTKK